MITSLSLAYAEYSYIIGFWLVRFVRFLRQLFVTRLWSFWTNIS